MRGKSIIAIAVIAAPAFLLGVAVGRYDLFPSMLMRAGYNYFRPAQRSLFYRLQAPLFEAFPGRANTVMVGDSITAFAQWEDIFPDKAIGNRGIQGDTIEDIRARLATVIQMHPHKVFIMGGINDLIFGSTAERVFPIYADAVRTLRSAGSQVFVQSTLLTAASFKPVINPEVRKLNDKLRKFCSVAQVCDFVDLNARLAPDGYLAFTVDGIHLTPAAYAIWRDEIAPDIAE